MAKYIDADLLRKEIEKRKKSLRAGICGEAFTRKQKIEMLVASEELDRFNRILDSLQQEQPSEGLEEAANEYSKRVSDGHNYRDLTCGFIAGAEWQKSQMISALKNDGELPIEFIDKFHEIDRNAFQNGQKNVKEQMLKEAVEGYVNYYEDSGGILMAEAQVGCPYHIGDKVKIVIVKEDKE